VIKKSSDMILNPIQKIFIVTKSIYLIIEYYSFEKTA